MIEKLITIVFGIKCTRCKTKKPPKQYQNAILEPCCEDCRKRFKKAI